MLRDGAGDSLLSARTSGARRSMCGRDKGAFFGRADVNGIQNCDANTTVCAPCKNNSDATKSADSCRIAGKPGIMSGRPQLPCGRLTGSKRRSALERPWSPSSLSKMKECPLSLRAADCEMM
jgi:hypothetical protein